MATEVGPTRPATPVAPSTPRAQSRNTSFGRDRTLSATFSRSNNSFTTVSLTHVPTSPTQKHKRVGNRNKRNRDASGGSVGVAVEGPSSKKRKAN